MANEQYLKSLNENVEYLFAHMKEVYAILSAFNATLSNTEQKEELLKQLKIAEAEINRSFSRVGEKKTTNVIKKLIQKASS